MTINQAYSAALAELDVLRALEREARLVLPILADFGRVVKWNAAGQDLGEPAAAARLRDALAAIDRQREGAPK